MSFLRCGLGLWLALAGATACERLVPRAEAQPAGAGDAGVVPVGWRLVPVENATGRGPDAYLTLATREGTPRTLVNLGVRGGCREMPPMAVAPQADAGLRPGFASVRCTTPEVALLHAAFPDRTHVAVQRSDCSGTGRSCAPGEPWTVVMSEARVAIPDLGRPVLAPLVTEARPELPPPDGTRRVTVGFERIDLASLHTPEQPMTNGLVLHLRGAVSRDLVYGPQGPCDAPVAEPGQPPSLTAMRCYSATFQTITVWVTRRGNALHVPYAYLEQLSEDRLRTTRHATEVPLPRGVELVVLAPVDHTTPGD